MGNNKYSYVGNYIRVWMPTYFIEVQDSKCYVCGKKSYEGDYCANCGTKKTTKTEERRDDPYELLEKIFGDGDRFHFVDDWYNKREYYIFLPNCGQDGGDEIGDDFEEGITERGMSHPDWEILRRSLDEAGIKHELGYGVVNYWM